MKLQSYLWGTILLTILLLTGCKKDDNDVTGGTGELHLSALVDGMAPDEAAYRFRAGQGVGVWLSATKVDADLNRAEVAKNIRFMQSAGGLVSDPRISWDRQPSLELYAYAPYDAKAAENPAAYAFAIEPRQDSLALREEGNERNDLLYARQTLKYSDEATTLSFHHLMSKVVLHIHSNSSTPGALVGSKVTVDNILLNASVDLASGTVMPKGETAHVVSAELKELPAGIEVVREAIIVPQKITVGTQLLEILTPGNYTYTWNTEQELNFESGKQIILDVLVKETECVVRIKEIAPWRDNETLMGEALENLPTYKVFDYYNRHGIQGIVISVDETEKHGWVVSLDETELPWATEDPFQSGIMPAANSRDDAVANLNAVLLCDQTLERFPAMKWCNDKNVDGVTGWVLPAHNVLKIFGKLIIEGNRWDEFNAAIKQAPGEKKNEMKKVDCRYHSSSIGAGENVRMVSYSSFYEAMGWGSGYQEELLGQDFLNRVRAFHEF